LLVAKRCRSSSRGRTEHSLPTPGAAQLAGAGGRSGVAFLTKRTVNIGTAKEHTDCNATVVGEYPHESLLAVPHEADCEHRYCERPHGCNATVDGECPHESLLAVPLLDKRSVAVARQKQSGMMFTTNDQFVMEALPNAQSHERTLRRSGRRGRTRSTPRRCSGSRRSLRRSSTRTRPSARS
jgi:hypothetical protein